MARQGIGASPLRREDGRFITGRGQFVSDIDVAGQWHCAFVRSPHAHARITSIEISAALKMPGVRAVLTGADMAVDGVATMRALWPVTGVDGPAIEPPRFGLARDTVCHVGEAVALVLAASRAQAEDAAEQVHVEYAELPAVTTACAALGVGAPQLHSVAPGNLCYRYERGDRARADAAFAAAAHVTRIELVNQRLAGCALEPRALLAQPEGADLTLHSSTQVPHHIRKLIAEELGMDESAIRVIAPDVGGGFGYKGKHYPEEIALAWAARRAGVPLKWTATRSESFLSDLQGRDHVTTAELALDAEGHFTALRVDTLVNLGAYVSTMGSAISSAVYSSLLAGMYRTPVLFAKVRGVFTNTLPTDAYRGAGRPEACYVVERLIDQAAREMNVDRAELRRRNLIPVSAMPYATSAGPVYDCGDFARVFERALVLADYAGFEARRASSATSAANMLRGIGIACYVETSGVGPSTFARAGGARVGLSEHAEISVAQDGRITAVLGTHSHGQGHETVFAQILAHQLGVANHTIEIVEGDTARIAQGTGTFGSRSIAVGGSALVGAALGLIAEGKAIAARLLGVPVEAIAFDPDQGFHTHAHVQGQAPGKSVSFAEAARASQDWRAQAEFDPASFAFSNGVHLCEVEVTRDTGEIRILRYTAVDDVGTVINPMIVEGQLHGGVAQGLGQALKEACIYDPATGQLLSGSFLDYGLPRAHDMPEHFNDETDESQPFTLNPLGAKGAGEAGTIAAPAALVSAVLDALRADGVDDLEMPLTPARVWAALRGR